MKLSPTEIFKGKKIFFIGGTGFVGKITLSSCCNGWNADASSATDAYFASGITSAKHSFRASHSLADEGVRVPYEIITNRNI